MEDYKRYEIRVSREDKEAMLAHARAINDILDKYPLPRNDSGYYTWSERTRSHCRTMLDDIEVLAVICKEVTKRGW